ncbi:iron-containing redox enzyme family protein [Streptosporangium sp. NPDC006007]|uniref:iron-containing redox enzyme family protein n=1 Tax=Streptosporangium sp. NPDC006007 TaxID=3154575 RepID=UPI0033B3D249
MHLPTPRGPITAALFERLTRPPHGFDPPAVPAGESVVDDEDLQLALFTCYELHYQGFDGVDDRWEWEPSLLRQRGALEERFERGLEVIVPRPGTPPAHIRHALTELVANAEEGPSLAAFLDRKADLDQFREFVAHRSVYHLKEADPHTWAIPRLFGLHRRHRGALLGHLAAFEMTSSLPNRRYGRGLRRLGGDAAACLFYDEHVQADAVHEQIAVHDMCGGFAAEHPVLAGDVLYGAACALALDRLFTERILDRWGRGSTLLCEAGLAVSGR